MKISASIATNPCCVCALSKGHCLPAYTCAKAWPARAWLLSLVLFLPLSVWAAPDDEPAPVDDESAPASEQSQDAGSDTQTTTAATADEVGEDDEEIGAEDNEQAGDETAQESDDAPDVDSGSADLTSADDGDNADAGAADAGAADAGAADAGAADAGAADAGAADAGAADAGAADDVDGAGEVFARQKALDLIDEMRQWPEPIKREIEERTGIDLDDLASADDEDINMARLRQIRRTWQTAAELATGSLRSSTRLEGSEFGENCPLNRFCQPRLDCVAEGLDPSICRALSRKRVRGAVVDASRTSVLRLGANTRPNTEKFLRNSGTQWRTSDEDFIFRAEGAEVIDELIRRREAAKKETVQLTGYVSDASIDPERLAVDLNYLLEIESFWATIAEKEDALVELRVHTPDQLLNLRQAEKFTAIADLSWLVGTELAKVVRIHTRIKRDQLRVRVLAPPEPEPADDANEGDQDDQAEELEEELLSGDLINPIRVRVEVLFFYSRAIEDESAADSDADSPDNSDADSADADSADGDSVDADSADADSADGADAQDQQQEPAKVPTREDDLKHLRVAVCHIEQLCLIRRKIGDDTKVQLRNLVPNLQADQYRNPRSAWVEAVQQVWIKYKDRPGAALRLVGHTDSEELPEAVSGDYSDVRAYSQFQAQVVAGILLQRLALRSKDLKIVSYGNERPLVNNDTALNRSTNRRIEVEVWYDSVDTDQRLPDEPQVCPNRSEEERVTLSVDGRRYGIKNIILPIVDGQPQISEGALNNIERLLRENSDKDNLRLYFVGHTDKKTLLRRVAKVYGDHFGLSSARALNALRQVAEYFRVNPNTMIYQGMGYLEPLVDLADERISRKSTTDTDGVSPFDLIVEDGTESGEGKETQVNDRVEVKVLYDQIARIQREYGLRADQIEIERFQKPNKPISPFLTNVMRVTTDGIPISDRRIHRTDVQRCTDVALADAGIRFKYDASNNRKRLNVSAHPLGADYLDDPATEEIENQVQFQMHTNYHHWIKRAEVRLFYADESAESEPLAVVNLNKDGYGIFIANIYMAREPTATELQYVLRVYQEDDIFDETVPARLRLHHNRASKLWIDRYGYPPAYGSLWYGRAVPGAPLPGEEKPATTEAEEEEEEPPIIEVYGAIPADDLSIDASLDESSSVDARDAQALGAEGELEGEGEIEVDSDAASDADEGAGSLGSEDSENAQNLDGEDGAPLGAGVPANDDADDADDTDAATAIEQISDESDESDESELADDASVDSNETAGDDEGLQTSEAQDGLDQVDDLAADDGEAATDDGDAAADGDEATVDDTEATADDAPPLTLSGTDAAELLKEEKIYDENTPLVLPALLVSPDRQKIADADRQLLSGYGESTLAKDNIEVYGGAVTVEGSGIPRDHQVWMLAKQVPLSDDGRFVAEEILPYGLHTAEIAVVDEKGRGSLYLRNLKINQNKWFYAGLFDLTLATDFTDGPAAIITQDKVHYNNSFFIDGQLGFYARGNLANGGIFRFSVDTRDEPIQDIFKNLVNKDPQLLFLRLDEREHYSTFGDDSEIVDDTPTQGRLFLRYEKNKSFVQWGTQRSDLLSTDLAQIDTDIYGFYSRYATDRTTSFGENRAQVDLFAADAGTITGRDEFRSTGGSLYVLSQRNLLSGSARLRIEVRDGDTGLTISSNTLSEGRDYSIDYIQGRVILLTPLTSASQEQELVRTGNLGGNPVYLIVRYDYTPGFDSFSTLKYGGRASGWVSDNWQIGATASSTRNNGGTSQLQGLDVRYRYSAGTWVGLEFSHTDGVLAEQSVSLDGGFTRSRTQTDQPNRALSANAWRLESSLQFSDLGNAAGNFSFFVQSRAKGFSAPGQIALNDTNQFGLSLVTPFGAHQIRTSYEQLDETDRIFNRSTTLDYVVRVGDGFSLSTGLRHDNRTYRTPATSALNTELTSTSTSQLLGSTASGNTSTGSRLDGIFRMDYDPASIWNLYTFYQGTLTRSGNRERNQLYGLGGGVAITERVKMDYELNHGSRGFGAALGMDFLVGAQTNLYVNYRLDNPVQTNGPGNYQGNLVTGFRSRIKDSLSIYGEERYAHSRTATGLTHAYGIDYALGDYWGFGFSFDIGTLEDPIQNDEVDRRVYTGSVSYSRNVTKISTLLQHQTDKRPGRRQQTFLSKTSATIRLSPSWRLVSGYTFSESKNSQGAFYEGRFSEATLGLGVRPIQSDIVNALLHFSLFKDTPAISQPATTYGYNYQQDTAIAALDLEFRLNARWSLGTKFAWRRGRITLNREQGGREFVSNAFLGILRVDWHLVKRWDLSTEYRLLRFQQAGSTRSGFLIGTYYHINKNFKIGGGYNFTDFTDDLRNYSFDDSIPRGEGALDPSNDSFRTQGIFISIVGKI